MFRSEIEFEGILNFLSCSADGSRLIRNSNEIELCLKMLKSCSTYRIAPLRAQDFSIWFILWISYEYRVYVVRRSVRMKWKLKTLGKLFTIRRRWHSLASDVFDGETSSFMHRRVRLRSRRVKWVHTHIWNFHRRRKMKISGKFPSFKTTAFRGWGCGKGESALNIYLRLWANMRSKEIFIFSLSRCDFVNFHSHLVFAQSPCMALDLDFILSNICNHPM